MKKTKVAFIGYGLYSGGAERIALDLTYYFTTHGLLADLIIFKNINDYKSQYEKILKKIKITTIFKKDAKIPKLLLPFKIIELIFRLYFVIRKGKYDILISYIQYHPYYLTILLAKLLKIRSVLQVGENIEKDLKNKNIISRTLHNILLKITFKLANEIVCVSEGVSFSLANKFKIDNKKMHVIHNGVNQKIIKKKKKEAISKKYNFLSKEKNLIVNFSRLTDKKGHFQLIRILKSFKEKNINIKLLIIGKGETEDKLKKLVNNFNLQNQVFFITNENKNPFKYLKLGKIFVFCSLYEGFGNVIVEAMNCGLPIISVDCPYGPHEILCDKKNNYPYSTVKKITYCRYGVLTPPLKQIVKVGQTDLTYEEKFIAEAILHIINDKQLQNHYKTASLGRSNNFTVNKMAKEYCQIIKSISQ